MLDRDSQSLMIKSRGAFIKRCIKTPLLDLKHNQERRSNVEIYKEKNIQNQN